MLITSAEKRDRVSIAITSSNFILFSLLGAPQGSILCSLFLIYKAWDKLTANCLLIFSQASS